MKDEPFGYTLELNGKGNPIEADYTELAGHGFFVIFNVESFQIHIIDDKMFDGIEETPETRDLVSSLAKLRGDYQQKKQHG